LIIRISVPNIRIISNSIIITIQVKVPPQLRNQTTKVGEAVRIVEILPTWTNTRDREADPPPIDNAEETAGVARRLGIAAAASNSSTILRRSSSSISTIHHRDKDQQMLLPRQ